MERKIIHLDMDAFYASVEQRDFPQYRHKPIIVGGSPTSRGVVATCSYEARKYGIHSAMASSVAYRLCPHAIFVSPRFTVYKQISTQLREILQFYTKLIEPLSLDEAYLDVTHSKKYQGSATLLAKEIKKTIFNNLKLTASAGVSYNKFLAKIASDYQKPDGLTVITPSQGEAFVKKLKVRQFYGVGKATEKKMHLLKIYTGQDLHKKSLASLTEQFGKFGKYLYNASRAIDNREIQTFRQRKSLSKETTFAEDTNNLQQINTTLINLAKQVFNSCHKYNLSGHRLTLKIKYSDFQLISRSMTQKTSFQTVEQITTCLKQLLLKTEIISRKIRLLGVGLANFNKQ